MGFRLHGTSLNDQVKSRAVPGPALNCVVYNPGCVLPLTAKEKRSSLKEVEAEFPFRFIGWLATRLRGHVGGRECYDRRILEKEKP